MTEQEMQAAVDQLVKDMMGKGLRTPSASITFNANARPCVGIVASSYGQADYWYDYPHGETVSEALGKARAIIADMPDAKTRQMQTFMASLGKVIDLGRENGIEVDFLNPLTETMKRLSENVITDQRGKK